MSNPFFYFLSISITNNLSIEQEVNHPPAQHDKSSRKHSFLDDRLLSPQFASKLALRAFAYRTKKADHHNDNLQKNYRSFNPYFFSNFFNELEFCPLFFFGKLVADLAGSESALGT